uniref:DUF632 domain-containing protein n=1 Tax=Kalanchoe fedtschenkoi TaxID=63787 RepID=A0A7N0U535_KALFE
MGCVASKLEQEEEVVAILRERKNYLKLAVERRYALAEAHSRYNKSLFAVSAAIKLFVARHSSPTAPFLITFPNSESEPQHPAIENVISSNPMLLTQTPTEPSQMAVKAIACDCDKADTSTESSEAEDDESEELRMEREEHHHQLHQHQQEQHMNGYYFMQMPPPMPIQSAHGDFGWDFFNPFEGVAPEVISSGFDRCIEEEDLKAVRQQEGIPELEEEGESEDEDDESADDKVVVAEEHDKNDRMLNVNNTEGAVNNGEACHAEQKGLTVIDNSEVGRELLEALRDIEDYFLRAYNSGKEVSRMLEANRIHLHSNFEEIKENSTKLLAIAWHRSTSSRPSSCKSLVASSSRSSSAWTETKNDLADNYKGMDSGSHSLTLERLYAWEKKLYEEAGDNTRKIYEKKCSQLKHHDARGDDSLVADKTRAAVKDLYARILVAIRSAESISRRIDKLRDEELQPQICELLQGLMRNWKVLSEAHQTQYRILSEVKTFTCPAYGKFCSDSQRLATLQLQIELHSWRTCFMDYIAATRGYVEAVHNWLAKFVATEVEVNGNTSNRRLSSTPVYHANGPPLLMTCHDWLESVRVLPDQLVSCAMKGFSRDVRALWLRQGEELQQKRKVESLAKEYERRLHSYDRQVPNPVLAIKLTDDQYEAEHNLTDKSDQLDTLRTRLDLEKEKHRKCVQETQRITLNGLQTGFCSVFESLIHFSEASLKMYSDLVGLHKVSKPSSVVNSHPEPQPRQDGLR